MYPPAGPAAPAVAPDAFPPFRLIALAMLIVP
jgi:hypothetical protein